MHSIFLSSYIMVYLFALFVLLVLQSFAAFFSVGILRKWDFSSTSPAQYKLERKSYLIVLIIFFTLIVNIVLLPFFAYSVDALSVIVSGAMCGAGVLSANSYGIYVFALKLIVIFLSGIWLFINKEDIKSISYKYMKTKISVFLVIYILFLAEIILTLFYLSNIPMEPVLCCSNIYGASGVDSSLPLNLNRSYTVVLFYLLYFLTLFSNLQKYRLISFISNLFFLYIAYFALIYFFGTYIYELPTHQCPFCMLQKEYYFVGYLVWGLLFVGVFLGTAPFIVYTLIKENLEKIFKYSSLFNTIFVLLCTYFVVSYYLKNGVLL